MEEENYDAYFDDYQFSQEDFAQIDEACAHLHLHSPAPDEGAALIPVELETRTQSTSEQAEASTSSLSSASEISSSPFELFRKKKRGYLTVSDLVGPTWCEQQYDYGLRQQRHRRVANRPASFVSAAGKTMTTKKEVATINEKLQDRGSVVHRVLERQVHPEKVPVKTVTAEDRWAVKLLDMLVCLESLLEVGKCREMPVFGFLCGEFVSGIIDELQLKPIRTTSKRPSNSPAGTPQKNKKARRSPSPCQGRLDSFLRPSASSSSEKPDHPPPPTPAPPPTNELFILDTKTRSSLSLPSDDDALASKLQVMSYYYLLSELIGEEADVVFMRCRTALDLDAHRPLSEQVVLSSGHPELTTLAQLQQRWNLSIALLNIGRQPSRKLRLTYRAQESHRRRGAKVKKTPEKGRAEEGKTSVSTLIEKINAVAPHLDADTKPVIDEPTTPAPPPASARPSTPPNARIADPTLDTDPTDPTRKDVEVAQAVLPAEEGTDAGSSTESGSDDDQLQVADAKSEVAELGQRGKGQGGSGKSPDNPEEDRLPPIIGRKIFQYDSGFLERHVTSVLQWWHGQRKPVGVELKDTRRCNSCEYHDDCEWLESKAQELREAKSRIKAGLGTAS